MRVWLLVYGVLYVVIEMTGHALATVGWPHITALDVATAVTDAFLTVAVAMAALLAAQLGARRWGPLLATRGRSGEPVELLPDRPIGVRSWRPAPLALPGSSAPTGGPGTDTDTGTGTYGSGAYGTSTPTVGTYSVGARLGRGDRRGRRLAPAFPEESGHLL
ncbi:hypothetical protein [Blastococcus montanus]|uniref:hypothetical protein n=1 Tax=Blastococcus montanus TaxID=3144973 RepID=UPI00320B49F8